jgi:hypothetical protein
VSLRRIGTFMSDDEVAGFSEQVDIAGLRAYWDAVGRQTEVVASTLPPEVWDQPLDAAALRKSFLEDGVFGDDAVREVELLLPHYLTRPVGGTLSHGALAHPLLHVGEASRIGWRHLHWEVQLHDRRVRRSHRVVPLPCHR